MNKQEVQNILGEYADSLIRGEADVQALIQKHNIPPGSDLEALLHLAQTLEGVLVQVAPSQEFVQRLKSELLGQDIAQLRRLRPYMALRLAAAAAAGIGGVTVAAGVFWWVRRTGLQTPAEAPLAS